MRKALAIVFVLLMVALPIGADGAGRLKKAGAVLGEILGIPEGIPKDLLDKAECVLIFPSVKKVAFVFGGSYGRGAMICRTGKNFTGPWGAPAMFRLEGASIGFQIGGSATDFVLLVMNPKGANAILKSKTRLGADASVAGGPKGRKAAVATDASMRAEVLTWSRSRGLFAGVSLEGSSLRQDKKANKKLYGRKIEARAILLGGAVGAPAAANNLVRLLRKYSPKNKSKDRTVR